MLPLSCQFDFLTAFSPSPCSPSPTNNAFERRRGRAKLDLRRNQVRPRQAHHGAISVRKMASQGYGGSGKVPHSEGATKFEILKFSHRHEVGGMSLRRQPSPQVPPRQTTKEPKTYRWATSSPKSTTTACTKNSPYVTSSTTNPATHVDPIRRRDRNTQLTKLVQATLADGVRSPFRFR